MSHVVLVPVTTEVPKELQEVSVALVSIIADIKAGKPIAEIAAGNFPKLVTAVQGFEDVDDAFVEKPKESAACVGLFGAAVVGALVG